MLNSCISLSGINLSGKTHMILIFPGKLDCPGGVKSLRGHLAAGLCGELQQFDHQVPAYGQVCPARICPLRLCFQGRAAILAALAQHKLKLSLDKSPFISII